MCWLRLVLSVYCLDLFLVGAGDCFAVYGCCFGFYLSSVNALLSVVLRFDCV